MESELYRDLFIDSRRFLIIVRTIEQDLGVEIDDEDILEHDLVIVQDLVDLVDRALYRGEK